MNAVLTPKRMTADEYLAWEDAQPNRHEYIGGEAYAMTGVRQQHNLVAGNAYLFLREALRGQPCRVFMSNVKLRVDEVDAYFYPDLMVSCDARDRTPDAEQAVRHPWFIAEVLSESTADYDRGAKFAMYRSIHTLTHYLLVEQSQPRAELHHKTSQGSWEMQAYGLGDTLHIESPHALAWPVATLFDDVVFPEPASGR